MLLSHCVIHFIVYISSWFSVFIRFLMIYFFVFSIAFFTCIPALSKKVISLKSSASFLAEVFRSFTVTLDEISPWHLVYHIINFIYDPENGQILLSPLEHISRIYGILYQYQFHFSHHL